MFRLKLFSRRLWNAATRVAVGTVAVALTSAGAVSKAGAKSSSDLTLAAGDVLKIQVMNLGLEAYSADVPVQADGRARLPIQPPTTINASGMTMDQFERAVDRAYARFIRNPVLVVTLKSAHISTVYLLGAFLRDAAYPIEGRVTALDMLSLSGGAPQGDLTRVVLKRGNVRRTINLERALHSENSTDNVELRPGDTLYIPERRDQIIIQGAVAMPKALDYRSDMSVEEAVAAAGGPTATADFTQVAITHKNGTSTRLDVKQLMLTATRDTSVLQPGDVVTVPEAQAQISVLGEVMRSGPVPYRDGMTLGDAVALAGGGNTTADLTHVRLARTGAGDLQTINLIEDRKKHIASQIILQPGDVVTVPQLAEQVFVLGAVSHPGPELYRPGMTVLEALSGSGGGLGSGAGAGGPTDRAALYSAAVVHPNGGRTPVDLQAMLLGGETAQNITLHPGDTLVVPESKRLVYVFGAVTKPGAYVLPDPTHHRVLDALQLAGGTTAEANVDGAQLVRPGTGGKATATPVHLDRLMKHGELQYNVELKPGDVLYLPTRSQRSSFVTGVLPSLLYYVMPFLRR